MILKALAVVGVIAIVGVSALVIWAAYELRRFAVRMDWTIGE